ncbi:hypothetical protein TrVE_jg570 [Triparma verrucosa]|uniref:Uncharacterized protein n=1 Tax=Triparma verrucosa TaxID=1606542 RepID=A0A9W7F1E9_9STRA|nr:hypothetical protein TrVE_jg570 [Triparma verrucosa]
MSSPQKTSESNVDHRSSPVSNGNSSNVQNIPPTSASTNPLASFALKGSKLSKQAPSNPSSNPWMSTKKSTKEVLKSKKIAEDTIRERKGLAPKSNNPKKSRRKDEMSDDSDEGDDLDGFIVHSDEEDEVVNSSDSDSEIEVIEVSRKSLAESEDEESLKLHSDSSATPSPTKKKRPSPPSSSPYINKKRSKFFTKTSPVIDLSQEEGLIDLTSETFKKTKGMAYVKKSKKKKENSSEFLKSKKEGEEYDSDGFLIEDNSEDEEDDDEGSISESSVEDSNLLEASAVLKKVKELSEIIIAKCSQWKKSSEPTLSNGALSLTSGCGTSWITKETLESHSSNLTLSDYQVVGVNWLIMLSRLKYDGLGVNGILGDEMGLGKTVQTVAFLNWFRENGGRDDGKERKSKILEDSEDEETKEQVEKRRSLKPHIVVVPASVLDNWEREFERFSNDFVVVKYHGSLKEREELRWRLKKSMGEGGERLDVVLTSFSYFSSEKSDDRNFLQKLKFTYMVIDEAHCLKDPTGKRYKNLDKFKTEKRILLTGTPVQNNPKELMSLLCFLMPFFKKPKGGGWDDEKEVSNDGGARMLSYFVELSKGGGDAKKDAYEKLKNLMAPFVLRRKKEVALKQMLPSKTSKLELVPFCPLSQGLYNNILTEHASRLNGEGKVKEGEAKNVFVELRKAANSPLLLRTRWKSEADIQELIKWTMANHYFGTDHTLTSDLVRTQLSSMSDFAIHSMCLEIIHDNASMSRPLGRFTLMEDDMFVSPKLTKLKTMLPELISDGHRILLFSQWTTCLDILECLLNSLDLKFFRLDGQTDISTRQDMIDDFTADDSVKVFLLSTRAGGMGINLTAADTVIIHDLDFNPTSDLQAEDRCHRIGQKKPVTVYKLVTEGSVDESIYQMQEEKKRMIGAVLNEDDGKDGKAKKKEEIKDISMLVRMALDEFIQRGEGTPNKKIEKGEEEEEEEKEKNILDVLASPEL